MVPQGTPSHRVRDLLWGCDGTSRDSGPQGCGACCGGVMVSQGTPAPEVRGLLWGAMVHHDLPPTAWPWTLCLGAGLWAQPTLCSGSALCWLCSLGGGAAACAESPDLGEA